MKIVRYYQRRMSFDVSPIEVEDPLQVTWLTAPGILDSEIKNLVEAIDLEGKVWAHTSDIDFVAMENGDLFYMVQVPGLYGSVNVESLKIPFFLFPIRSQESSFFIHVYTEQDMASLEPFFNDGFFITSRKGLQVCYLEPVPESLKELTLKHYCGPSQEE